VRRRQLIEIEDQSWCPAAVRDGLTDYLQFITDHTEPYAPAARLLAEALRVGTGDGTSEPPIPVVDLGSGGGGPWRRLVRRLHGAGVPVRVRLTDLHPNLAAFERIARETAGAASGDPRAVPADAVPDDLVGLRTIFTAFHHFPPEMARRVLADDVARGHAIAVFESTARTTLCLIVMLLVPHVVWLVTPFIRPFRWSRLLLTYLFPVIPTVAFIDGVVSCLRTYTPDELRELAKSVDGATGYDWTAGHAGGGPIPMTYLVGTPVRRHGAAP